MRKFYLFVLSMLFATLSVFAQFTNNPKVVSEFNPSADSWVKVCFVDNKGQTRFMTAYSGYFKGENEKSGDSADQLFQLVGADLNNFQLVSKTGSYLYADLSNNNINASSSPNTGAYNVCLVGTGDNPIKAYQGIAPKILKFSDADLYPEPQYWEWEGYINGESKKSRSSDAGVVFKVVGGDVPPSDPAEGGGGTTPEKKTFSLTKATNGSGTFKICKRGTTDEIADLAKIEEGTEIDIIASPANGFVLKQINDGTQDCLDASTFDPKTGFATTYSGLPAVSKNASITVTFVPKEVEKQKFMLLKSIPEGGGTFQIFNASNDQEITGDQIEEGTTIYIKAIPEDGYILKQVNVFGQSSGQGNIFQDAQFDPKTGFALTVRGINPINQNTRVTVTFAKKQEEEKPEEEVKNAEGFTNAPSVVPAFDANATKWYKIYFISGYAPDQFKVLTVKGEKQGLKAENNRDDDDNQLFQLVGTDRNDFQLVSKSGIYIYSKVENFPEIDGTATAKTDKYQLKLIKPNDSDLQTYKGVPTKMLKFIDRDHYDVISTQYGDVKEERWVEVTGKDYNGGVVVVFKQIGEDVKPVEKVSVTIQREAYKGDVSIVGVTEQPTVSTDQEATWVLESGKEYTLDVQAKKGWEFSHIYDNRYTILEEKTFTASKENTRVEVHFKEKKYSVKLNSTFDGGRVDVTNAYVEKLPLGFNVQLSVTPDAGYELESLTVGGNDITTTKSFDVDEDNTIVAVFKKKTTGTLKTLTNEGGSVTFQGHQDGAEVTLGQEVNLVVTPNEGYELTSLKVGGKDVKDSKKFSVGINNTIEAVFQKKTYMLTAPATTGGKIQFTDVKAGEKVEYGQAVAITATPEEGYELASLTVGGKDVKDAKSFIVGENNEVVAVFKKKTYTLTLPAETEQGAVEFEGYDNGDKAEYGTEVSVKILPKKGYELESITAGGKDITATKKFVVGDNNDIIVKWTEKLYTLVAPKVNGGHIEFLGVEEGDRLKIGQKVRIKVVPNKGYTLDKLTAGGKDISADQILTVDENNDIVVSFRKATAIELLEGISFAVYPNPATEFVKVEGLPANAQVEVLNLTGKRVLSAQADFTGALELNVSHLPKGLYLVRSGKMVVKLQVR